MSHNLKVLGLICISYFEMFVDATKEKKPKRANRIWKKLILAALIRPVPTSASSPASPSAHAETPK